MAQRQPTHKPHQADEYQGQINPIKRNRNVEPTAVVEPNHASTVTIPPTLAGRVDYAASAD